MSVRLTKQEEAELERCENCLGWEELVVRYDQGNGPIRLLQMITVACALRGASVVDRPVGRGPEVQ